MPQSPRPAPTRAKWASTAVAGRPAHLAPVAIGLTLVFSILMGALTGAAFNPARAGRVTRPGAAELLLFLNNCDMLCERI
jgi:hypothetical protein